MRLPDRILLKVNDIEKVMKESAIAEIPGFSRVFDKLWTSVFSLPEEPTYIDYSGVSLKLDPHDFVGRELYLKGSYEPRVTAELKKLVEKGSTVIDAGAHIGHHTVVMSQLAGQEGHVFAFEPHPVNAGFLRKTIEENNLENIELLETALLNESKEINLGTDPTNLGGTWCEEQDQENGVTSRSIRLDEFLEKRGIDRIDLLKIDVEGSELDVLRGLGERIEDVEKLIVEIHQDGRYEHHLGEKQVNNLDKIIEDFDNVYNLENGDEIASLERLNPAKGINHILCKRE